MAILITFGQFILALIFIISIHEMGHLLMAKLFKMRVEKYMVGFPPKVFSFRYKDTEYGLGMIPLGGFVKIAGMIDEFLDTKHIKNHPDPWEFRAKPAWQRLIVILGGIIFNMITGIIIFILLTYYVPKMYYAIDEINKHGVEVSEYGKLIGFQRGDKIIRVNDNLIQSYDEVIDIDFLLSENPTYTVLRNGKEYDVILPGDFLNHLSKKDAEPFISILFPFKIGEVVENSSAQQAGLKKNDRIINIGNHKIDYFQDVKPILYAYKGKQIDMLILREKDTILLKPTVNIEGKIGFLPQSLLKQNAQYYGFKASIPIGIDKAFRIIYQQIKAFRKIFKGDIAPQHTLSGPVGIAQLFGTSWETSHFWKIVGILSVILAFMNLLPIPVLDGGHAIFIFIEMITGRKLSDKVLINVQKVGFTLLILLMIFAFSNDIYKLFS